VLSLEALCVVFLPMIAMNSSSDGLQIIHSVVKLKGNGIENTHASLL
jgi:hypothetical protein